MELHENGRTTLTKFRKGKSTFTNLNKVGWFEGHRGNIDHNHSDDFTERGPKIICRGSQLCL